MISKNVSAGKRLLLLTNIGQLLTLRSAKSGLRRGPDLSELAIVDHGAVLCAGGKIVSVGTTKKALRDPWIKANRGTIFEIDCANKIVLPGFVDSHTHPAFICPRLADFEKRIAGASYEEISKSGGGIQSTVESVRAAGKNTLAANILKTFEEMAAQGTTTAEAKSGYGLDVESELKSLEAIRDAATRWPGTVVPTLLGAHIIPAEFKNNRQKYVDMLCREMIPRVAEKNLAAFVDVFTERGAFNLNETELIFAAARDHHLGARGHVGQLTTPDLRPLLKYNPASLDHLDHVSNDDIQRLSRTNIIATLVPAANYFLGLDRFPPARKLIDSGVTVALATDFNPGSSPTTSMPFVMSVACTHMKMSPAEAITASTINGACALNLQDQKGSIEPGKDADMIVSDVEDYRELPYWIASNRIAFTILNGIVMPFSRSN